MGWSGHPRNRVALRAAVADKPLADCARRTTAALLAVFVIAALSFPTAAGAARRFALVVGVSRYPKPLTPLDGPLNDVTLVVNTLVETKWTSRDHIRVLADDLEHAYYAAKVSANAMPTIGEIRQGFDWLASTAAPGDEVIVYLSGHGSYVPSLAAPGEAAEPDGVDEVFLPLDIGAWSDTLHGLKNQLIDNEIGAFLARMRAKGAKVWLIADSCNSGTLSRADVTIRSINPIAKLGVPANAFSRAVGAPAPVTRSIAPPGPDSGRFVGFYAAQPSLDAIEVQVPLGGGRPELRVHGLFTWYLIRAVRSREAASFERIARAIVAGYWEWRGAAPIPMFEGDLAGASGFAGQEARLYPITSSGGQVAVNAGILDGVDAGTRFDLLDLRGTTPKKVGTGHGTSSTAERTLLELDPARAPAAAQVIQELRTSPEGFGAQVTSTGFSLRLTVALDPLPAGATSTDRQLHERASADLAALLAAPASSQTIALAAVAPPALADVRLVVRDGRVWFAGPSGDILLSDGAVPQSLEAARIDEAGLARVLAQIGHGRNLLRAGHLLEERPMSRDAKLRIFRKEQARTNGLCQQNSQATAQAPGLLVADTGSPKGSLARFKDCDLVTLVISNQGRRTMGVTPLYVDAWSHIDFLYGYEGSPNGALVVDPGQTGKITYTESLPTGAEAKRSGRANLVLLMTAVDGSDPFTPDYRSLATNALQPMRAEGIDPTSPNFLLAAAGAGGGNLRSVTGASEAEAGAIIVPLELGRKP